MAALTNRQRQSRWRKRHLVKARAVGREAQQNRRDAAKAVAATVVDWPAPPANKGKAFIKWTAQNLTVPAGHPAAGSPFILPDFLAAFFIDVWDEKTVEAALIIGRKNGKSAATAAYLLSCIAPSSPLRREGYRAGICSINREKAHELRAQIEAIAVASGLEGIDFWRRGPHSVTAPGASIDILSADKNAGAASSYDDAVCDEIGLLGEQNRGLVSSMRSSVSAKAGKFLSLSVWGDGPFCGEIVKRRNDPGVCVHLHQAPEGCKLDDSKAWELANPGLDSIKSRAYMVAEKQAGFIYRVRPASVSSVRPEPPAVAFSGNGLWRKRLGRLHG